jgi:serine/threonine protein kinase/tetratricopeptide (TPR) repeat protein
MIGQTIGQYKIEAELGKGGMGVVYRARDIKLNRLVALKFVSPFLTQDPVVRERFAREAQAAAAIDHSNICTVHDIAETDDGRTYIVMAYYGGLTLSEKIKDGSLKTDAVKKICMQIASALSAAHKASILHRDIKPGNIALTEDGDVKLLDFGLAKLSGAGEITKSGGTIGTVAYMSPEQIRGEKVDHRSDLWSLGVLMHEMLTGSRPFRGEYDQALAYTIQNEAPTELPRELDTEEGLFSQLISGLLEKDKDERIDSADLVAGALGAGDSTGSGSHITFSNTKRRKRRTQTAWVTGFVILLIVSGGLWSLQSNSPAGDEVSAIAAAPPSEKYERVAVMPFSIHTSPEFDFLGDAFVTLISTKLDGAGSWRAVNYGRILAASQDQSRIQDPDRAAEFVEEFNASMFVLGSIFETSGQITVTATLYNVESLMEPIGIAEASGPASDYMPIVDRVAQQLLVNADGGPTARVSQIAGVTTESVEAFKAYLDGENAFYRSDFLAASTSFERATELDSTFALAWYRLAVTSTWLIRADVGRNAAARAVENSERLSDRYRDLLLAMHAHQNGKMDEAEALYRLHLASYPEESEAWFNLAELLFHDAPFDGRSFIQSKEIWERILEQEPNNEHALVHLARIAAAESDSTLFVSLFDRIAERSDSDRSPEMLVHKALLTGTQADRLSAIEALRRGDAQILAETMTMAALQHDNAADLQILWDEIGLATRSNVAKALGYTIRAQMMLMRGHYERARQEQINISIADPDKGRLFKFYHALLPFREISMGELQNIVTEIDFWDTENVPNIANPSTFFSVHNGIYPSLKAYLLGVAFVRQGELMKANEQVRILQMGQILTDEPRSIEERLASAILGRIALAENRLEDARDQFRQTLAAEFYSTKMSSPFFSSLSERFLLANTLVSLGEWDEALPLFKSFEESSSYDRVFRVPGLIGAAEIYEWKGNIHAGLKAATEALRLWSDADPEFDAMQLKAQELKIRLDAMTL